MYYLRIEKLVMFVWILKDIIILYYRFKVEMEVYMRFFIGIKYLGWIEKRISVLKYVEVNVVCGLF